jgi:hypothetical protein
MLLRSWGCPFLSLNRSARGVADQYSSASMIVSTLVVFSEADPKQTPEKVGDLTPRMIPFVGYESPRGTNGLDQNHPQTVSP